MAGYALQFTDESLAYAIHHIRGVYTEAAKRLGLSYNQFVSMRLTEVQASLKNNKLAVNENELNKRYHDHLLLVVDGESFIDTGKIYNKFLARTKSGRAEKQQGLKGVAAYEGDLVRGKVHIITNENEIKSFKKGEILVTPMTNPTFVPAMRKAAAILTDDGGLLCHAAIVSREMKKPCLIGTKNATKILKNGDVIEVDTNKGTVKIL